MVPFSYTKFQHLAIKFGNQLDELAVGSILAQYSNLLNAQNLLLFPWKHTAQYHILCQ